MSNDNGEGSSWLQDLMAQELSPAELADKDREAVAGRAVAAELLTQYLNFCLAIETEDVGAALSAHLHFQYEFARLTKPQALFVTMVLCDLITQELNVRHGGMQQVLAAARADDLFLARNQQADREQALLNMLEKEL